MSSFTTNWWGMQMGSSWINALVLYRSAASSKISLSCCGCLFFHFYDKPQEMLSFICSSMWYTAGQKLAFCRMHLRFRQTHSHRYVDRPCRLWAALHKYCNSYLHLKRAGRLFDYHITIFVMSSILMLEVCGLYPKKFSYAVYIGFVDDGRNAFTAISTLEAINLLENVFGVFQQQQHLNFLLFKRLRDSSHFLLECSFREPCFSVIFRRQTSIRLFTRI